MRILVVNKFYWPKGGSERVFFELAARYERAGHEVAPFAMSAPENRETPWARYFAPEVRYESARGGKAVRAAFASIYSREAKRRIAALIREFRPDVAHLHNFHHQLSPSIVDALRDAGVPTVHTLHDYQMICPNYLLYTEGAPCERCLGGNYLHAVAHRCVRGRRTASAVAAVEMTVHRIRRTLERGIRWFVSPSRFLAGKLTEAGIERDRIRVVANGIDPAEFTPASGPGESFLFAGRLSREKGLDTLLDAIERLPGARLDILGTGPEEERLRGIAADRFPDRVRFHGWMERADLLARLRSARAVVLPSRWYENAPLSALEALASGVPVVASNLGGLPEVVRPGETGLLVEPGNAGALADALRRLADDPVLSHDLGRAGRRVVETEYTLDGQAESMLELLREVSSSVSR